MVPTALAGGAARRTAAQADGGRACTCAARKGTQPRVLKPGCSTKGTQPRVLKQALTKATQSRVLNQGCSNNGTHKGYSNAAAKVLSGACGRSRGKSVGSARQCCAHSEYGSTYRVLTYSRGTPGVPTLRGALPGGGGAQRCARVQREGGYSRGTHGVLIGYSQGTHEVLKGYCASRHARESLSGACGSQFRTQREAHRA
jgi:hypothetical protein